MDQWKVVTTMVTVFAFSLEIRPMDSFLTAYLTGPEINVTLDEVSNVLTPIRIYVGVLGSFLVFLLADYLRYKPVMIFNGLIGMLTYVCLMNSPSLFRLKIVEVGLSLFTCTEVSYFGYTYAKIKGCKEHYQTATGYIKAGMLSGRFVSGLLGQSVAYLYNGDYYTLSYYSLASVTFASVWACFLPAVRKSTHFHTDAAGNKPEVDTFSKAVIHNQDIPNYSEETDDFKNVNRTKTTTTNPLKLVYKDYKQSYTDFAVLRWSVWHIIGMATYVQVFLYVNILYTLIADAASDGKHVLLNGVVDSLATVCAAFCCYKIGNVNVNWLRHGDVFLTLSSLTLGLVLFFCGCSANLYCVYVLYIFYSTLVQSVFVIIISQIAKELKHNCYTLILGFNSFLAIVLSTCTSMLFVRIGTSVPVKFLIYGGIYAILGVLYGCIDFYQKVMLTRRFHRLS